MIDGATSLAYCVGGGASGQLGNGATGDHNQRVAVSGSHLFTSLSGGNSHTCGVNSANGEVWCWGSGSQGQLGNGAKAQQTSPVRVIQ